MSWAEDFPHIPIHIRCTYRHLIDPNVRGSIYGGTKDSNDRRFKPDQIKMIRSQEGSCESIAKEWKVSYSTIYSIKNRETYKDVE